jgi:hypothetical protein
MKYLSNENLHIKENRKLTKKSFSRFAITVSIIKEGDIIDARHVCMLLRARVTFWKPEDAFE